MQTPNQNENEIKLYNLLVEQLLRYQSTLWQIPIALLVANFIVISNFIVNPLPLIALLLFNFGMILIMHRMINHQRKIIEATRKAEEKLNKNYEGFLPTFNNHKLKAPYIFIVILYFLEYSFLLYILTTL